MADIVIMRSVVIAGHRTSVSMEELFWTAFKDLAQKRGTSVNRLIELIDKDRGDGNLSSAIRCYVMRAVQ